MMNPIIASSGKRRMRSLRTPLIITAYGLMIFGILMALIGSLASGSLRLGSMRGTLDAYIVLIAVQFLLIVLVSPAMTAGSIAGERERETLELLLVTNTGSFSIAFGKLLESFAFLALLVFSTLPMMCVMLVTGGVSAAQILTAQLYIIVSSFAALSIGLFTSALLKKTVTATIVSYIILLVIGVGTLVLPLISPLPASLQDIYSNEAAINQLTLRQTVDAMPKLLFISPGMGLLGLLSEQTSLLESTLSYTLPRGYQYYNLIKHFGFERLMWVNMASMTVLALIFTGLSALFVRPRVRRIGRRKKA